MAEKGRPQKGLSQEQLPLGLRSLDNLRSLASINEPAEEICAYARSAMANLNKKAEQLREEMEIALAEYTVAVTNVSAEPQLTRAIAKYWPSSLEANNTRIPYAYYYGLGSITEADADYVRERYEFALGDIGGCDYLEIWELARATEQESLRAFFWLKEADDTSSFTRRAAQVMWDWSSSGLQFIADAQRALSEEGKSLKIVQSTGGSTATNSNRAAGGQIAARRRLRECSLEMKKNIERLRQHFGDDSLGFYQNHLDKARTAETNLTSGVAADTAGATLFVNSAYASLIGDHQDLIDDLARRHQIYFLAASNIIRGVTERRVNRALHDRLSSLGKGRSVATGNITVIKKAPDPSESLHNLTLDYLRPSTGVLQDALKGSFGIPSRYNPFVTLNDPRLSLAYLGSLPWSGTDNSTIGVHPEYIMQALSGIGATVTADNLDELTDGSVTSLHGHSGLVDEYIELNAVDTPDTPPADHGILYYTASGTSPNREIALKFKNEAGTEVILASWLV